MGIDIRVSPREICSGPKFQHLANSFAKVKMRNAEGLNELRMFMEENFGVQASFAVTPNINADMKFFGFRAYPVQDSDEFKEMLTNWSANNKWYIEIDRRLVDDYSNRLTPIDISYLFIQFVDRNMSNNELGMRSITALEAIFDEDKMDWKVYSLFKKSKELQSLIVLLIVHRAFWVNFASVPSPNSIVGSWIDSTSGYQNAVAKLKYAYGTFELIDRKYEEYDRGAAGFVQIIYESVNDIKHSAFRFRKNLIGYVKSCTSPYGQKMLLRVYRGFSDSIGKVFVQENSLPNVPRNEMTKEMIAMENEQIDAYWRNHCKRVLESADVNYLDHNGYALKCNKLEVDELMVRVADIDSTDDKIFILEKIHKNLAIIDNALAMLADKEEKHKVKQTETELRALRDQLLLIREKVFKAPVGPTHYGLFIKYPAGYEG